MTTTDPMVDPWDAASLLALVAALERGEVESLDARDLTERWAVLATWAQGIASDGSLPDGGAIAFAQSIDPAWCEEMAVGGGPAWIVQRFREVLGTAQNVQTSTTFLADSARLLGQQRRDGVELPEQQAGRVEKTAAAAPRFRRLVDVPERDIEWFWPGRIVLGEVVVLAGDGGVGKSTLASLLASGVTRGHAPEGGTIGGPRSVLVLTVEENAHYLIRPRMRLMGADLGRVHDIDPDGPSALTLPRDEDILAAFCAEHDVGMITVDPGPSFMDEGLSSYRDEAVRSFLAPLHRIAHRQRAVVLVLAHLNKATGLDSGQRIMGGAAWRNAPRNVLMVGAPPGEDPRETRARLLAVEKNNVGVYPPALAFELVGHQDDTTRATITWGAEVPGILARDLVGPITDSDTRTATDEAGEWLRVALGDGPRPAKDVQKEATEVGITEKPLRVARERLGVRVIRNGFGPGAKMVWSLPADGDSA